MIFDSHAHYDDEAFDEDREEVLASLKSAGITKIVNVSSSIESVKSTLALAKSHDFIYASVGLHPCDIPEMCQMGRNRLTHFSEQESKNVSICYVPSDTPSDTLSDTPTDMQGILGWLEEMARDEKCVAIGEIGLDYYWDTPDREIQKKWFRAQLELAKKLDMPIIVHSRDAAEDTYNIMKEMGGEKLRAVIHCFSYEKEMAERFLKLGYYIGIGGVITYKNARKQKEVLESMPLERLLLETDCPYLTPVPHRGERNSSMHLPLIIKEMAAVRGASEQEIEDITYKNACEFYQVAK